MAFIVLPAAENPRVVLDKISFEISVADSELDARARVLDELLTLSNETAQIQAGVAEAKKSMFQLLAQQLSSAQVRCVDEYTDVVAAEMKALEERQPGKGGPLR